MTINDIKLNETSSEIAIARLYLWYFLKLLPLVYGVASAYFIFRYQAKIKEQFSHYHRTDIAWLWGLTLGFMMLWSWTTIIILVSHFIGGDKANIIGTIYNYLTFVLVNALFYFSVLNTRRVQPIQTETNTRSATEPELMSTKPIIELINKGIFEQAIHLEPNINIEEFSQRIGVPVKVVSNTMNRDMNVKFFEFINAHRIEHSKKLLSDPQLKQKTILDILLMSGFNNKSSFHRFFNRMVGIPPTDYRKKALAKTSP